MDAHTLTTRLRPALAALATAAALLLGAASAHAEPGDADIVTTGGAGSCTFKVTGKLVVRNPTLTELNDAGWLQHGVLADNTPLKDVEIRVSGRTDPGTWNSWGSDYTDADGNFTVTESKCDARVVKVEARFHNGSLDVSGPDSPKWYSLYETSGTISPSLIDLQQEALPGGQGDQATSQARTDAQTWAVYQRAIDYIEGTGHGFHDQVVVHNPSWISQDTSFTDPPTGAIHIDPSQTTRLDVMLHELGHAWSYPYVDGEGCLTNDVLVADVFDFDPTTRTTHDASEKPCVAFEEGFAQFFARKLEYEMHSAKLIDVAPATADVTPRSREYMRDNLDMHTINDVAHKDVGWEQAFRVLTASDLPLLLFGDGTTPSGSAGVYANGLSCHGQPLLHSHLADALQIVGDSANHWNIKDIDIMFLLLRAADRGGWLSSEKDIPAYYDSIDPADTTFEPHMSYGC